jgi:hypothetical protein
MDVINRNRPFIDKLHRLLEEKPVGWQDEIIDWIVYVLEEHDKEILRHREFRTKTYELLKTLEEAIHAFHR